MASSQDLINQLEASEKQLLTAFSGDIATTRLEFLGFDQGKVRWQNGLGKKLYGDSSQWDGPAQGLEGIVKDIHAQWVKWNNWYIDKTDGGGYSGPNYSKKRLRQSQEFYLTLYYNALEILQGERNKYKALTDSVGVASANQEIITTIAENEREEAESVLITSRAKSEIANRNILLYILPLIAIAIIAFLIWKRKIK